MKKIIEWYVEDRTKWIMGITNMPEYYEIHISEDPFVIKRGIMENGAFNLERAVKNGELSREEVDDVFKNSTNFNKFVEGVFQGLKENFPLVEK
jgi:hypothetical protein